MQRYKTIANDGYAILLMGPAPGIYLTYIIYIESQIRLPSPNTNNRHPHCPKLLNYIIYNGLRKTNQTPTVNYNYKSITYETKPIYLAGPSGGPFSKRRHIKHIQILSFGRYVGEQLLLLHYKVSTRGYNPLPFNDMILCF